MKKKETITKKLFRLLFHRLIFAGAALVLQLAVLLVVLLRFNEYFVYFYAVSIAVSVVVVLYIINNRSNPAYKIAWITPILLAPVFGGMLYLLFGGNRLSRRERRRMSQLEKGFQGASLIAPSCQEELRWISPDAANQSEYIRRIAGGPPYQNTQAEYLPLGEVKFRRMLEELEKAEHYIFMEYFIIQEGAMWDPILEVLVRKAKAGLDVRVMYDDIGCMLTLPAHYKRTLEAQGIKCRVFNPFVPVLSSRLNNRDHRKICVIDGHTGFTGGINLADEYINAYPKHGHWKDTAVRVTGEAVRGFTLMFLQMWAVEEPAEEDFSPYLDASGPAEGEGWVMPYGDSPFDRENVGEMVYMDILNRAVKYVHITTPYLIIDQEMITALTFAAKRGVDVKLIVPSRPDKRAVFAVTKSYYQELIEGGVEIYEYTPGFIHAKMFVSDGDTAVVGSINLDYRSLYLHFECAAMMYGVKAVGDIERDFQATLAQCRRMTVEDCRRDKLGRRMLGWILRPLAPLM